MPVSNLFFAFLILVQALFFGRTKVFAQAPSLQAAVKLNSASGQTCEKVCQDLSGACVSIGTDEKGENGLYFGADGSEYEGFGCRQIMRSLPETTSLGSGQEWVNCRCLVQSSPVISVTPALTADSSSAPAAGESGAILSPSASSPAPSFAEVRKTFSSFWQSFLAWLKKIFLETSE